MTDFSTSVQVISQRRLRVSVGVVVLVHAALLYAIHLGMLRTREADEPPQIVTQMALVEAAPASMGKQTVNRDKPVERTEPRVLPKTKPKTPPNLLHTNSPQAVETVTVSSKQAPATVPDSTPAPAPVAVVSGNSQKGDAKPAAPSLELPTSDAAYLRNPVPPYPPLSEKRGEDGTVKLKVYVNALGEPEQVLLEKSSGFDRLDQSALDTVKHWRFVPGKKNGVPAGMWHFVPYKFVLPSN